MLAHRLVCKPFAHERWPLRTQRWPEWSRIRTERWPEQGSVCKPARYCSQAATGTTRLWHTTTLAEELGVATANEDDLYAAMDWLLARQARIEQKLAKRHLSTGSHVLYDVTSSYYEGSTCPLARFGYNRDQKQGTTNIV